MRFRIFYIVIFLLTLIGLTARLSPAHAAEGRFLGKEDIILYSMGLKVEPAQQTVPKNIATIVSAYLQVPAIPDNQIPPLPADAVMKATLRGPSLVQPLELTATPNTLFNIPPLAVAGLHTLDNIRIESGGGVFLYGQPESVTINVIDQLLVTQVTSTPLTAEQIRQAGIVFDSSNFQAYNFIAAFAVAPGQTQNISFPVILPNMAATSKITGDQAGLTALSSPQLPQLSTIIPDTLKIQTKVPNMSVVGFHLKLDKINSDQALVAPPIPGVIVIPGDIGFLNQYFSVMLMVGNAAPAGSNLVVQNLTAEIVLPAGNDGVVGTSDDPLAMAMTDEGPSPRTQPVAQPGPDDKLGTADDIPSIGPGQTGNSEFLIEGRREGDHIVEMNVKGTLIGLPVGPVQITGQAAGSVLVRNPNFTLTFTHPQKVNAGENYSLDVTVTNTSSSPANFVSINLMPKNISGATLIGSSTKQLDYIAPGDSSTLSFDLQSKVSGNVFAATLDSDQNVTGRFQLKTLVGELGIPLSPDSLILPKEANSLPKSLRDASLRLLGKAYSVATAPSGALPADIKRFSKKIVWDMGVQVAEAGFRYTLHEPLADTAKQLLMDFDGSDYDRLSTLYPKQQDLDSADADFTAVDELRRRSVRGDAFANAVADILSDDFSNLGADGFQSDFAQKVSYRPGHISVIIGAEGGQLPFDLSVMDSSGRKVGGIDANGKVYKEIPFSDYLTFTTSGNTTGEMAMITAPNASAYRIRLDNIPGAPDNALFTLGIIQPTADGRLMQTVWKSISYPSLPAMAASGNPQNFTIEVYMGGKLTAGNPIIATSAGFVGTLTPSVISVVQQPDADMIGCPGDPLSIRVGRIVATLFNEEITPESVQDKFKPEKITNYGVDNNKVVGVALQPDKRIAYIALRDPVGPYVQRQMTFSNITDGRGNTLPQQTVPIETTIDADGNGPGGVVSGKIIQADGTPVALAATHLVYTLMCEAEGGYVFVPFWISSKNSDSQGKYTWDYVTKLPPPSSDRIIAVDPLSGNSRTVDFIVARDGQQLNMDIVFLGRGSIKGTVYAQDGVTPLARASIRVTSLTDYSQYGGESDQNGYFIIPDIPVGNILVEAVHSASNSETKQSYYIAAPGTVLNQDLILMTAQFLNMTIKYGELAGHMFHSDGTTSVSGVPVVAYYKDGSQEGVRCPCDKCEECAIAMTKTGADGSYSFDKLTAGILRIYSVSQAEYEEGSAMIQLAADTKESVNVLLSGGLGTVKGKVLDADGNPVSGAQVGGGLSITTTNAEGEFTLTDVPAGDRSIVAVSNTLGVSASSTINITGQGDIENATIVFPGLGSIYGTVYQANGAPVSGITLYLIEENYKVVAMAKPDSGGNYRMNSIPIFAGEYTISAFYDDLSDGNFKKVSVKVNKQIVHADITFRGKGTVAGFVYDSDGATPLKARVGISALKVDYRMGGGKTIAVGWSYVQNQFIVDTNLTTGRFSVGGIFVGPFTIAAVGVFSPDPVTFSGEIPAAGQTIDVKLQLQATSQIKGTVYQSDGFTPVGKDVAVAFKSNAFKTVCSVTPLGEELCDNIPQGIQEEDAVTDENGNFLLPIVNPGKFTLTAQDPATGKTGQTAHLSIRLLGKADVIVKVKASDGVTPIPGANVEIEQTSYPNAKRSGITDGNGVISFTGGDDLTEGAFIIHARDMRNGFAGRASGKVAKDGETVTVNVYLYNASGAVSGTLYKSDGLTPVPNAQIYIFNDKGSLAYDVTDANGQYSQDTIPLGKFNVDAFEPASGRRAAGFASVDADGQQVQVNLVESAEGQVKGIVMASGTLDPLKGWTVQLQQQLPSGKTIALLSTTGTDGSYSFPGVSLGAFVLSTKNPYQNLGQGNATGVITREGEIVDMPVVVNLVKPALGNIQGIVYNEDGTPAANAGVVLRTDPYNPLKTTSDENGNFIFTDINPGRFSISAQSQVSYNSGKAMVELKTSGETAFVTVVLKGIGLVTGTTYNDNGTLAPGVQVVLEWPQICSDGSPMPIACTTYSDNSGRFSFSNVPAGSFSVSIQDPVTKLNGSSGGSLSPGGSADVRVVLQPTGKVSGIVLFGNGKPAQGVIGQLSNSDQMLWAESGMDGTIAFNAVPMGSYTLDLKDPIGPGIARASVNVAGDDDLGSIVLDEILPSVKEIDPSSSSVKVPFDKVISITFSRPVDPATVTLDNVSLKSANGDVTGYLTMSNGNTTAVFTPLSALQNQMQYTVRVSGIKDLYGRVMPNAYTSTFTTVDIIPPSYAEISPSPNLTGVAVESVIRIQFSKPIDPSAFSSDPISLTSSTGHVDGRTDYTLGNTVIVFTPARILQNNTDYHVSVLPATDVSGNVQSSGLAYDFKTTDNSPPVITSLLVSNGGLIKEGTNGTVTAQTAQNVDIAYVDFYINGVFSSIIRTSPFVMSFQAGASLGKPGDVVTISAKATDTSGITGPSISASFTIKADLPPTVQINAPAQGGSFGTGSHVTVTVNASDDIGVARIAYQAAGGQPPSADLVNITPPAGQKSENFGFFVPVDAVPGSTITINALAVDTKGQVSNSTPVYITVLDALPPTVNISGLSSGNRVNPGDTVTAVVSVSDNGAVASIGISATGAAVYSETRSISPALSSAAASFTFTVPQAALAPGTISIKATAVDEAGNSSTTPLIILTVADLSPPAVQVRADSGRLDMVPGGTVKIVVDATDNVAVAKLALTGTGAFTYSDARSVSPPLGSAEATFTIIVPATLAQGDTITLTATATDTSENVSAPASITLTAASMLEVLMPSSLVISAGDMANVNIQLSAPAPQGGVKVDFAPESASIASVTPFVFIAQGSSTASITVQGISGGSTSIDSSINGFANSRITVTVQGGAVSGTVYQSNGNGLAPAAAVNVNVNGTNTMTDASGEFKVLGITGPGVGVTALDTKTQLRGYASGSMNMPNGYLKGMNILLIPAGSISGDVILQDRTTRTGEGAKVDIFKTKDPNNAVSTVFTDENGHYEFPLVEIGSYVVEASESSGNRGRTPTTLSQPGQEAAADIYYLARGTVNGTVVDGNGIAVPNVIITLNSHSIFGDASATATARQDGTFTFDNVFAGTFSVSGKDPKTNMGGAASGAIANHAEIVNVTIKLSSWAALQGIIYGPDGTTPVGGANVSTSGCNTSTDAQGHYHCEVLPLGTYTVTANDQDTWGRGEGTVTLDIQGQTKTLDITFHTQGTVVATVLDANGQIVANAGVHLSDQLGFGGTEMTGLDGAAVFDHVNSGNYSLDAWFGDLRGSAIGSVSAGKVSLITVNLQPEAGITGTVFEPDGVTAAINVTVRTGSRSFVTGADGSFNFEGLPLGTYSLRVYDGRGRFRAMVDNILLQSNGEVQTVNATYIGLGTVTGRILMPEGTSAINMGVKIQSMTPLFGGTYSATTDAAGYYSVDGIPVGNLYVSSGDASRQLFGEASGSLASDGSTATIDIVLTANVVMLPLKLLDGNSLTYNIQSDGKWQNSGSADRDYGTRNGGSEIELISGGSTYRFVGGEIPTQANQGRQVVLRQNSLAGLNITRKIFVPKDGYFARYLESFSNPTGVPITVDIRLNSDFNPFFPDMSVITTSSGDNIVQASGDQTADYWATFDDATDPDQSIYSNMPASAFVWAGPDSGLLPNVLDFQKMSGSTPARFTMGWSSVTIQPGETVSLLHAVAQQVSRDGAKASAERLSQLPPEFLQGLSASDISTIKNFNMPADGNSKLTPLPTLLSGSVSGTVFAPDGTTAIGNGDIYFKSNNSFFGRAYHSRFDGNGSYDFVNVPAYSFSLLASKNYESSYNSPIVNGNFPAETSTIVQDIVYSNMGMLSGTIRYGAGAGVPGAKVTCTAPGLNTIIMYTAADGSYGRDLVMPGSYTVSASVSQGTMTTSQQVTADIQAGVSKEVDITFPVVQSLSPGQGGQGATLDVAVTGSNTNFQQGLTSANFGPYIVINSVNIVDSTHATVNITINGSAALGAQMVSLTTGGEVVSLTNGFTIVAGTPQVISINPASGHQGDTADTITITGLYTHWVQGTTTADFGQGITVQSLTVNSATSATVVISISPSAPMGNHTITMTTGSEVAALVNGFTVITGNPQVISVNPTFGYQGVSAATITITGQYTNWVQDVTTADFGQGITVQSLTVNSAASATAVISISSSASLGTRTVTLTTGSETAPSGANAFTVMPVKPAYPFGRVWAQHFSSSGNARGVVVDQSGDIYVLSSSGFIQKFDAGGNYLAQIGSYGSGSGQMINPGGIAIDSEGSLYVANQYDSRIDKFDWNGNYVLSWGVYGSGNGQFSAPAGVAVDASGNVYVADTNNSRIQKFYPDGSMELYQPYGMAVDAAGNMYVAGGDRIEKFDPVGNYLTQWGTTGSGQGQFRGPSAMAIDSAGDVYVTDTYNNRIQKFDPAGNYLGQWGTKGGGNGQFSLPQGVAVDTSGNMYVADTNNNRIQKFDALGNWVASWGGMNAPQGIAVDAYGNMYVADTGNNQIVKLDPTGRNAGSWGVYGSGNGQFSSPVAVAVDSSGNVFVADAYNNRVQMFDTSGNYLTQWGTKGSGDGQFAYPSGVAVDAAGNVYVVDADENRVQEFMNPK